MVVRGRVRSSLPTLVYNMSTPLLSREFPMLLLLLCELCLTAAAAAAPELSLPTTAAGGYLPTWMLFISSVALFNTVQTFISPTLSKKVYDGKPEQGTSISSSRCPCSCQERGED